MFADPLTDARAVFETTVNRLGQKPETLAKAKPIYAFFHEYESHYGELSQIRKLEQRIANLFPDDPKLSHFARRFSTNGFDPTALRPIISPATQTRSKAGAPAVDAGSVSRGTPPQPALNRPPSPKRQLAADDSEPETGRPRKAARSDSPLKGAAGRRLDQQKRNQQQYQQHQQQLQQQQQQQQHQSYPGPGPSNLGPGMQYPLPPAPLPRDIAVLLSMIPRAEMSHPVTRYPPEQMVRLLQYITLPSQPPPRSRPAPQTQPQPPPPPPMYLPTSMAAGLPHGKLTPSR